nr:MAG TPA: hypothetical protein [Caudoviricetes sp.]
MASLFLFPSCQRNRFVYHETESRAINMAMPVLSPK